MRDKGDDAGGKYWAEKAGWVAGGECGVCDVAASAEPAAGGAGIRLRVCGGAEGEAG